MFIVAILTLIIDQVSKIIIEKYLIVKNSVTIIKNFLWYKDITQNNGTIG